MVPAENHDYVDSSDKGINTMQEFTLVSEDEVIKIVCQLPNITSPSDHVDPVPTWFLKSVLILSCQLSGPLSIIPSESNHFF